MSSDLHNLYVGTHSGILKGISFKDKQISCQNYIKNDQQQKQKVVSLSWVASNDDKEVRVCCSNWYTRLFNPEENYFVSSRALKPPDESAMVTGFSLTENDSESYIIGASKSGIVKLFKRDPHQFSTLPNKPLPDRRMKQPTLDSIRPNPFVANEIACGGCENDLSIWDLNNTTELFKAKNVALDMLQLRVPIHVSDLQFLEKSVIATCTRYHQIRLYDTRAQRKPIIDISWEESPFTRLVVTPNSKNQVVVGTAHGRMALFDLRKTKPDKHLAVYKYFQGSVQDIALHPTLPIIFSVSADRFLRVHHVRSRQVLYREYLNSRLSRLLLGNIVEDDLPFEINPSFQSYDLPKKRKLE